MNTNEDRFTAEQIMEVERRTRSAAHSHEYSGTVQQAKRYRETASILRQAASDTARIAELTAEVAGYKSASELNDKAERMLSELVDKIVPGLDTGDLLEDAMTASKAIDVISNDLLIAKSDLKVTDRAAVELSAEVCNLRDALQVIAEGESWRSGNTDQAVARNALKEGL